MIAVGAYPTRTDAELARTVLTGAGVPSEIEADDAGGAYPFDLTGAARLVVDDADAADASALLNNRPTTNEEPMPKGATMINPDTNPHVGAHEMVDRRRRFLRAIHAGSDEQPRIGSFATGLASVEPRPWDGKQMVGARGSGSAGAHPDEQPTSGSFATGLAKNDPRPWDGRQVVGALRRGRPQVLFAPPPWHEETKRRRGIRAGWSPQT